MLKFIIKLPNGSETSFYAQDEDVFIGRIPSINDVCINDPSISRQHAHIKRREEGYVIYDLKSLNGLILNGAKVAKGVLRHGDRIQLGEVVIDVSTEEHDPVEVMDEIESFEPTVIGSSLDDLNPAKRSGKRKLKATE